MRNLAPTPTRAASWRFRSLNGLTGMASFLRHDPIKRLVHALIDFM